MDFLVLRHLGIIVLFILTLSQSSIAQVVRSSLPPSTMPPGLPPLDPDQLVEIQSTGNQETIGAMHYARGSVRIRTAEVWLTADEVDFNDETGEFEARGKVHYESLTDGFRLDCDHAKYNAKEETGEFFDVSGYASVQVEPKLGVLTTTNPFYMRGQRAEKLKDRYILHNGFISDCSPEDLWWRLNASTFDVIPHKRAIAHQSTLRVKNIPVFYFPAFYKSLEEQPRRSGFLLPTIGNSSRFGQTVGAGFFWAINRSYDLTYRAQFYTKRGIVHQADFEGWVNQRTYFDSSTFIAPKNNGLPAGYILTVDGKSQVGKGWEGRGELRQLSSLGFRQQFTQSFDEAISSETHSIGFLTKHWKDYAFNFVAQRNVNYQDLTPGNDVVIRKLPEAQFITREHQWKDLPIWVSMDSSYGLDRRTQPQFQTRQFVQRADIAPRITSAVHWFGLDLSPTFTLRDTAYDSRLLFNPQTQSGQVIGQNLNRLAKDVQFDLGLPRLSRVFNAPKWLRSGDKVKHVIEARVRYRYVTGINNFQQTLRFDDLDVMSNTNEVEFNLSNRLLKKNSSGGVDDVISWQLFYKRYLDPTFGGAVVAGQRNVVESADLLTGYAFLNGPRNQSPISSVLRVQGRAGVEWRTDYDPVRHAFVNSSLGMDVRFGEFLFFASHNLLKTDPILAPTANQLRLQARYGGENRRGWNYGFSTGYDFQGPPTTNKAYWQFIQAQATYNTDCCGFSVQYSRFNGFTAFNNSQIRVAFALANIGSFGTLRRQNRIF